MLKRTPAITLVITLLIISSARPIYSENPTASFCKATIYFLDETIKKAYVSRIEYGFMTQPNFYLKMINDKIDPKNILYYQPQSFQPPSSSGNFYLDTIFSLKLSNANYYYGIEKPLKMDQVGLIVKSKDSTYIGSSSDFFSVDSTQAFVFKNNKVVFDFNITGDNYDYLFVCFDKSLSKSKILEFYKSGGLSNQSILKAQKSKLLFITDVYTD